MIRNASSPLSPTGPGIRRIANGYGRWSVWLLAMLSAVSGAEEPRIELVRRKPDPYGSPRPAAGAEHVPINTSIWFQLELTNGKPGDAILPDSITLKLTAPRSDRRTLIDKGRRTDDCARGWLRPDPRQAGRWMGYVDLVEPLKPGTRYTVQVTASSRAGVTTPPLGLWWRFTTQTEPTGSSVHLKLDLQEPATHWRGSFFAGICNVVFCTSEATFGPLYSRMSASHAQHPDAWRLQRDIWLTAGDEWKPDWATLMDPRWPNMVHELETRRVTRVEQAPDGVLLHVTAKFGCEQYGVSASRPLSSDYKVGMEVLVADGKQDARAKVKAVNDQQGTVLVQYGEEPDGDWRLAFRAPPPSAESKDAPGRFASGGTYLRRFDPPGTPVYYWKRLDKEYDLVRKTGRRIVVNFVEAPPDLSLTGRPYTRPKDYAEWHDVVRTITAHLIERYGDDALGFYWSVFNEPDIVGDYWRFHWDEAQRFYDYTVDAVLRSFEDHGYDSANVRVGGWELGAIFGTHLRLKEVLAHCSPRATAEGALATNAAFEDVRLQGRRSRRVEGLCRAHAGAGSPCDFISVHTYNRAHMAAAKMIRAKEMALQADAEYFRDLAIHTHESCPGWNPPPDPAAADSYLGNGYFPSWCFDVTARLLDKAHQDSRYGRGESVITIWPPPSGLQGVNTLMRHLSVDDNGDSLPDRRLAVPNPIFHALTLLSDFHGPFWVDVGHNRNGTAVSALAARADEDMLRVAIVCHHGGDIQSRSQYAVPIQLDLAGAPPKSAWRVTEYHFDRRHNSYFVEAKTLQHRFAELATSRQVTNICRAFDEGREEDLPKAIEQLRSLSATELSAVAPSVLRRFSTIESRELRELLESTVKELMQEGVGRASQVPRDIAERIARHAELRVTSTQRVVASDAGQIRLVRKPLPNSVSVLLLKRLADPTSSISRDK